MVIDLLDTDKRYDLIYADPPWKQSKGGKKSVRPVSSGTELDYPTASLDVIKGHLAMADGLTGENSILFLWTIDKYLFEAEEMAKSLGYKLHARMIWNKVTGIPAAFTVRFGHEYLLYMYKGKLTPVDKREREVRYTPFSRNRLNATRRSQKKPIALSNGSTPTSRNSNSTQEPRDPVGIAGEMRWGYE